MIEQVLFDILLYLPVMSLLRFKTVCKEWYSLIESSAFVTEHLNHYRDSTEDNLIILGFVKNEAKFELISGSQYEECVYYIENWQCWHNNVVRLVGYCGGVICLGHREEIALWNPALNQLKPLPSPLHSLEIYDVHTSIGIDIKSNDYKLVRICLEYRKGTGEMISNRVEVYNLTRDESWRIIHEDDVLPFCGFVTFAAISSSKSGMCFWIAYRYNFREQILLSFDFSEDLFRIMLLPDAHDYCTHYDVDLLDEKVVCIMRIPKDDDMYFGCNYEIWMLHDFGVEESWNKIYRIGPVYYPSISPLGISKNLEFLMYSRKKVVIGKVMLYLCNLHDQRGKFHQSCNLELIHGQPIIHYNASLLSFKRANNVVRPPVE